MRKRKKSIISIILAFVLCFSPCMSVGASATMVSEHETSSVSAIENGHMYLYTNDSKTIAILTDDTTCSVSASIMYNENAGRIYEFEFHNISQVEFQPVSNSFWLQIVNYMEKNLDEAKIVEVETVMYEEPIDKTRMRSSAVADLQSELIDLVGNAYADTYKATSSYAGQTMKTYETMAFQFSETGTSSWSSAMTVSSFIVSVLGKTATTPRVKTVCSVFGVALSAASKIAAGSCAQYRCRALITRNTKVGSISTPCNTTAKYIDYLGLENTSPNNTDRAYISSSDCTISYSHDQTYFNSYSSQAEDAYYYYLAYYN